ncbi:MAG: Mannose-6-phosphate isomerase, type II [Candidatus Nomurabacteria bacterium GW2011_GWF2_35_66]|uniref:Mannose-6-phosphate isomerase, type II n=1 Tax=Candidatus Nomurabacteria bacterium GW2011_GWE1_35_16 TaxID=1618761 RepID=A0A0G0EFC2_9BACT|nr:MAG: Mannose-6-phosphate isomerase, type II [Candidatus Nomurabacteria bacterium GW2011_GWF1_34_20]KKP62086.1 MAG: Mannose-6-phosphate isomerase, type II [Candidatus Nomurabacteria bacterium GW2011_GWE2_34_25]KKP66052.1 MAG: Mannose-6-phosphate isomerase, type II [Candidatus Nomurabacteria bacterium GW2011_GWE1_35_16]KKP83042.1 MAG: Mannose-6-phosphate isomerase, type II [Candidatus Nomurabacteria bacterium GW2011_GWF2_35_66]HAE36960.1 mannose-6-phosphate isomerase [Candidatus Nomurabacteria
MIKANSFQVERPWGNFRQFTKNAISTVKIITVNPNESLSLQSHEKRSEFWHVISGSGTVEIGEVKKETTVGDEHEIAIGEKHRLSAGVSGIQVLEIATGEFDESDIVHFEDKYGRV